MAYTQAFYIFVLMVVLTTAEARKQKLVKEDHAFIKDERIIKKQNYQGKAEIPKVMPPNLNLLVSAAAIGYKNDFQPTTPQKSPGIGHSFAEIKDSSKDFRYQAFTGKKNGMRKMSETDEAEVKHMLMRSIDDFRPTRPGHSPGVGHSFTGKKDDNEQIARVNDIGVKHTQGGNIDDFRPTGPGHRPGVGHSFTGKKDDNKKIAKAREVGAMLTHNGDRKDFLSTGPGVEHALHKADAEPKP